MAKIKIVFPDKELIAVTIPVRISDIGEVSKVSFELLYELSVQRNNEIKILALSSTNMVCYNYQIKKVAPLPEVCKSILII
ncbi:MAG: hypothetical protein IPJ81_10290 [Chitinophagaceae bacterium]|nr:hypothetical protein [Chitinophagaceae bacterium]